MGRKRRDRSDNAPGNPPLLDAAPPGHVELSIQYEMLANWEHLLLVLLAATVAVAALHASRVSRRLRSLDKDLEARDRLLADASHEVRTPLAAIVGFARELRDHPLTAQERGQAAEAILRNGEHVLQLVSALLDWSRLGAGVLNPKRVPVDLSAFLVETVENFHLLARQQGLELHLVIAQDLPPTLALDPMRLRQVLWNLLANAFRYTERGGITLCARRAGPEGSLLHLEVQDTGTGMTRDQTVTVFDRYRQVSDNPARRNAGFGLGLAISQQTCEALGGSLQVESRQGVGSRFWFTLPLVVGDRSMTSGDTTESKLAPIAVLAADDGADHRTLLTAMLTRAGTRVTTVHDGREAVEEYLRAASEGRGYDAVILDLQMPEMDGVEAASRIRSAGFEGRLLALTADDQTHRARRCHATGFDEILQKPVRRRTLVAALQPETTPAGQQAPP